LSSWRSGSVVTMGFRRSNKGRAPSTPAKDAPAAIMAAKSWPKAVLIARKAPSERPLAPSDPAATL
jgi:hypothetical protein